MNLRGRLRRQDGFIRDVVWLGLVVAVAALVLLDAMSLFNAYQSTEDSASTAAIEARNAYAQTQDVGTAQAVAEEYLNKADKSMRGFETGRNMEGSLVFKVSAQGHADTYGFKYLQFVGLKGFVDGLINPTATGSSS